MKPLQKQCIGIDISKKTFTVCVCSLGIDQSHYYSAVEEFPNDKQGFNRFVRWAKKQQEQSVEMVYLMETTGVYYESLAYHLHKIKKTVHVVLPNIAKHYMGSLNQKTKTDKIDAQALSRFGVERKFSKWEPPAPIYKKLKSLCRYRVSLKENRTMFLNQISSIESSEQGEKFVKKSLKELVKKLELQIKSCEQELLKVLEQDEKLAIRVKKVCTIKGVGIFSALTVIAETAGFAMVKSSKQLTSFAGLDVIQRQSGTSIKGKTRISKKGNSHIRRALYFPAMVAARFNPQLKAIYKRIVQKGKPKKVANVALERKLLCLIYALWKNEQPYIENYEELKQLKSIAPELAEATQDSPKTS